MPLGLRQGVSFCEASGHLVFLDIDADRYFGLDAPAEAVFGQYAATAAPACRHPEIERLLRRGLLVDAPDALPLQPCPPPQTARASVLDRQAPRVSSFAVAGALVAFLRGRMQLRLAGLAAALRSLAASKARLREGAGLPHAIPRAAAMFGHCALLVRSHDQCLARSLALTRHLASHGEPVDFVIGVRVRPFSAHAWVQKDGLLLNESCDGVRGYTPILVL